MIYRVQPSSSAPALSANWLDPAWAPAETADVEHFRPESSAHRPQTSVRLLLVRNGLHGIFHVRDRFVRCTRTGYFAEVWKDSCVEFFVQPGPGPGYFNLEFNCGGAHLCSYITDPTRVPGGFARAEKLPPALGEQVLVRSSLPSIVDPELPGPIDWTLQFFLPFRVLEPYVGPLGDGAGKTWRGNFFKCAEEVSQPHWASWSPVDEFNFHLPRCFGTLLLI